MIIGWKIDAANVRAVPFGPDRKPLAALELHLLFQACFNLATDAASERGEARDEAAGEHGVRYDL